jgi:phosphate uptake regulator
MAESRKIVKSGNTSYIVSLPINWIRKNELESGKKIIINENDIGDLVISPESRKITKNKEITTIKVDKKDRSIIWLELLTAYIRDSSSIIFEGTEIPLKAGEILDLVKSFIALDVIEQSTDSITVKNFFYLDQEMSPRKLLKKMDIVNRASMNLLGTFFDKGFANEDFFELQKLDNQNQYLFTLIRKCVLKIFENPKLMSRIQTNYLQTSKERILAQAFMHISTNLLTMGKAFLILGSTKEETKILGKVYQEMKKDYQVLVSYVNSQNYPEVSNFLKQSLMKSSELEKTLKMLSDPLAAQIAASLLSIYYNLRDVGYETLA